MSGRDTVPCSICGGTGQRHLTPTMRDVLDLVRSGVSSSAEIHRRIGGGRVRSAISNTLTNLLGYGLVRREPVDCPSGGVEYAWLPKAKGRRR